jgi:hypothetical protein
MTGNVDTAQKAREADQGRASAGADGSVISPPGMKSIN